MRYRPKHVLEYLALRGFAGLVLLLPHRVAMAVGWGVAFLGHRLIGFRRAEAHRRIRLVLGPGVSSARVRRIAWVSWRNLCFNVIENIRMHRLGPEWIRRHTNFYEVLPILQQAMRDGQGALTALPHSGNWDLTGVAAHRFGIPIFFIARRQKNPLTDAYINARRGVTGVTTVLNDTHVLRNVIRLLRQGQCLAILPDVRARTPALAIPFLGGTANLGAGVAMFSRSAGVPVFPTFVHREGWFRHELRLFEPIRPDMAVEKTADWTRMMQALMSRLEEQIRLHPEQYFWFNKRWVLDPMEPAATPDQPAAQEPAVP
jgi:KDO2-lipid IV(A) lauroyltransferase